MEPRRGRGVVFRKRRDVPARWIRLGVFRERGHLVRDEFEPRADMDARVPKENILASMKEAEAHVS